MEVKIEDIRNLSIYKDLMILGSTEKDISRGRGSNFLTLNISNPALGEFDSWGKTITTNITIYSSGYVREYDSKPNKLFDHILGDKRHIMTIDQWEARLIKVSERILSCIVEGTMGFGFHTYDYIVNNKNPLSSRLRFLLAQNHGDLFFKWLHLLEDSNIQSIVDLVEPDLTKMINKNPGRMIMNLKEFYKIPAIKNILGGIDPDIKDRFSEDLKLVGGLAELGIQ